MDKLIYACFWFAENKGSVVSTVKTGEPILISMGKARSAWVRKNSDNRPSSSNPLRATSEPHLWHMCLHERRKPGKRSQRQPVGHREHGHCFEISLAQQ